MLELIRRHQYGIMVIVAGVVILAFAWWGDFGRPDGVTGRAQPFISLGGKTYSQSQISKLAAGSQVAQRHFPFHSFQVERTYRAYDMQGLDYAINTLALREHAVDYGIAVSPEEIDKRMLSMPEFQTPEARAMAYRIYGSLGLGEGDVAQIVADVITMEKLSELLSAGILASDAGAEYDFANRYQTIFGSVAMVPEVKAEDVEITEEELKEAYEARKAELTTQREVEIRYVFFEAPKEPGAEESGEQPSVPLLPVPEIGGGDKPSEEPTDKPAEEPTDKPSEEPTEGAVDEPADQPTDKPVDVPAEDPTELPEDTPAAEPIEERTEEPGDSGEGGESGEGEGSGETGSGDAADGDAADGDAAIGCEVEGEEIGDKAETEGKETDGGEKKEDEGENLEAEPAETGEQTEATVEGAEDAAGAPELAEAGEAEVGESLSTEEWLKQRKEFNALVDQFWGEFFSDGEYKVGVDFAEMARDERYGVKVVETGLFSMSNPPEEIAGERELVAAAVSKSMEPPISDPIAASGDKKGYYIFEITKVVEPRGKTFEESKEELGEALRRDKASEASLVAADEAREKVVAAMADGKSFAEAAVAAGLEAQELAPFSPAEPPAEPANLREMLPALLSVVPGEVSEPVDLFDGGKALVFVSKRELWKRADAETLKDRVRSNAVSAQGFDLLGKWFSEVRGKWNEKLL